MPLSPRLLSLGCRRALMGSVAWVVVSAQAAMQAGAPSPAEAPEAGSPAAPVAQPAQPAQPAPPAPPAPPVLPAPPAQPNPTLPTTPLPVAPMPVAAAWAKVLSVKSTAGGPGLSAGAPPLCAPSPMPPAPPNSGAGAVVGAVAGAVLGSQIGSGAGQALATAAGVVGGAILGDRAESESNKAGSADSASAAALICPVGTVPAGSFEVIYEYAGQPYITTLPYHPGALLQVQLTAVGTAVPLLTAVPAPPPMAATVVRPSRGLGTSIYVGPSVRWGSWGHSGRWVHGHRHRHWRY